jgi:hypothetical protein
MELLVGQGAQVGPLSLKQIGDETMGGLDVARRTDEAELVASRDDLGPQLGLDALELAILLAAEAQDFVLLQSDDFLNFLVRAAYGPDPAPADPAGGP